MYYKVLNGGTGTVSITTNGNHNVKKYAIANVNVQPNPILIGTYSDNTTVNVAAYRPKSVSQFFMKVTNVSYSGGVTSKGSTDQASRALGTYSGGFYPSMSLSNNVLTISNIKHSNTYQQAYTDEWGNPSQKTLSGSCTLTVQVWFVG